MSKISIHAPRTGSDIIANSLLDAEGTFQSTLPARGATQNSITMQVTKTYFNPRSPHGERRTDTRWFHDYIYGFQSTLPARGATLYTGQAHSCNKYFNPRSPHGERQGVTR